MKVFPLLKQQYDHLPIVEIESVVSDNIKGAAASYRKYVEVLAYLEHSRRYKDSEGYAKATFDDYLKHRFNLTAGAYYAARKIYCQFPSEAEWLGVGFLAEVQRKCGVEAIEPVVEELSRKDSARVGPITVADKEAILKKFAKPVTKKDIGSALTWKTKYEAEHRLRLVLDAENKELLEQVAKLKATIRKYEAPTTQAPCRFPEARA